VPNGSNFCKSFEARKVYGLTGKPPLEAPASFYLPRYLDGFRSRSNRSASEVEGGADWLARTFGRIMLAIAAAIALIASMKRIVRSYRRGRCVFQSSQLPSGLGAFICRSRRSLCLVLLTMLLEFVATSLPQAGEAENPQARPPSPANREVSLRSKWFDSNDSTPKLCI